MRLDLLGVRGSTAAPGPEFVRYGGHTSCVAVTRDGDRCPTLVLDAGTGLRALTGRLEGRSYDGAVLLSHLHWDHVQGLPFFAAGDRDDARVDLYLPAQDGASARDLLAQTLSPPAFPITPEGLRGSWTFHAWDGRSRDVEGFTVRAVDVEHKGGRTFGYRVTSGSASLAYMPDHSPTSLGPGPDGLGDRHDAALALAEGVDLLITDAQHLASEFPAVADLGHASVEYGIALAREARVGCLALFHHAPARTDPELDEMQRRAGLLAGPDLVVMVAREGLVLEIPGVAARAGQ